MQNKSKQALGVCLVLTTCLLWAAPFWDKPYTEWKQKEVLKMLNDSPWAGKWTEARSLGGRNSGTLSGERELYDSFTVRFFSALPVRQAYVRLMQLMNNYDEMSDEQKSAADQRLSGALRLDVSDRIIVALEFDSNNREFEMYVNRTMRIGTLDQFRQYTYLISDSAGRVSPTEFYPPSPDGTGAKFIFPRYVDGKPVVSEDDKEIKFEWYLPDPNKKIYVSWKVKKMIYDGKLEI